MQELMISNLCQSVAFFILDSVLHWEMNELTLYKILDVSIKYCIFVLIIIMLIIVTKTPKSKLQAVIWYHNHQIYQWDYFGQKRSIAWKDTQARKHRIIWQR